MAPSLKPFHDHGVDSRFLALAGELRRRRNMGYLDPPFFKGAGIFLRTAAGSKNDLHFFFQDDGNHSIGILEKDGQIHPPDTLGSFDFYLADMFP